MRPALLHLTGPSLGTACAVIILCVVIGVALWWWREKRRGSLDKQVIFTGVGIAVIAAVVCALLLRAGKIEIKSYGMMLALGFVGGIITAARLGRRRGVPAERLMDLGLAVLFGSLIGARLMFMWLNPDSGPFMALDKLTSDGIGGLSFHGGLIGGLITGSAYIFFAKLPYWRVTDCVAPGIALGYAITRIGCFLNGCCHGTSCDLPWAVQFPGLPGPVHPTQIYAMLMGFAMFGILLLLSRGSSMGRAGRLFMVFLALEGVERFVMEIFRARGLNDTGVLSMAQMASIVLIGIGIIGWFIMPKRAAVENVADNAAERTEPIASR